MAEYREVIQERLYVKEPGTDRLRKTAAGRLKHLVAIGWRETDRRIEADHVVVRLERTGHAPLMTRLPKITPSLPPRRGGRGFGRGFQGGGRGGGPGRGPGGGPGRGPGGGPGRGPGQGAPGRGGQTQAPPPPRT